jgi:Fe-S cluster assembly iron-binding protein IscA
VEGKVIPVVTLGPGTSQAILSFLSGKGLDKLVRIDLGFTGCCDASLCMAAGVPHEGDMVVEAEGLTFSISPDTYQLSGDINISYVDEPGREGFSITSSKPVSEWDGFGVCNIKI